MTEQRSGDSPDRDRIPRRLPPELLAPSYQNRLRTIGRELDIHRYRSIAVVQVDGGFIVRAVQRTERDIDLLQFPDDTFPERMILATEARGEGERRGSPSPMAPTGYEDLLRAVGRWLDERNASNVTVIEGTTTVVVSGDARRAGAPAEFIDAGLDLAAVQELLDGSFRLRGGYPQIDEEG